MMCICELPDYTALALLATLMHTFTNKLADEA